jgi:hypothetical protein
MVYIFFDTAVNGYYTLTLLRKEFGVCLPLMPAEEGIADDVAPFIFEVEYKQLDTFLSSNGVTLKEIVLVESPEPISVIQSYFSKYVVQTVKERQFYFRFWSSTIFKKFILSCDAKQLTDFFGPVQNFICEHEDPSARLIFSFDGKSLSINKLGTRASVLSDNQEVKAPGHSSNDALKETILTANKPRRKFFE